MTKISVIVPCFNAENYIRRCLDSVLKQTFEDFEVIVINDGSTDCSADILNEYTHADNRIKVFSQVNKGLSEARNSGLKMATGEYICFLDADDFFHSQLLEITLNLAQKHSADVVCFDFYDEAKDKFLVHKINPDNIKVKFSDKPTLLVSSGKRFRTYVNVWCRIYKRELLDDVDFIPNIRFEDYPYTLAVFAKQPKTVVIPTKLYYYANNLLSITHMKVDPKQISDYHVGMNYVFDIYKSPSLKKELTHLKRKFLPNILKQQLGRCLKADDETKPLMLQEFAKELIDLDNRGLISWRGHKFSRYLMYRSLIKTYQ